MPKIVVNAFLTLDGVMQAPSGPDEDRDGGFLHGGWLTPYSDGDAIGRLTEGITDADGFLLGRKTYDIFANYWPRVTDLNNPIATALNSRSKYVVSRSVERVTLNNSSLIKGDVVAEIRKLRPGVRAGLDRGRISMHAPGVVSFQDANPLRSQSRREWSAFGRETDWFP
jgi:dihydrofolate reductase